MSVVNKMNNKNNDRLRFIAIIIAIYWASYFGYIVMANVTQSYIFQQHLDPQRYPWLNIIALRMALLVTLLNLLTSFQAIHRQRSLLIVIMALLVAGLCLPFSLNSYPFVSALENLCEIFMSPWLQLYVPPAFRATISGISTGFTGIFDLSSTLMENNWRNYLAPYYRLAGILLVLLILFWHFSGKKQLQTLIKTKQTPRSFYYIVTKHFYIFIAFLFAGLNLSIFNYTFLLAKEVLPHAAAQYYQNALYIGSIIGPIIAGRLADKKDIFFILMLSASFLIVIKLIEAAIFKITLPTSIPYYFLAFIEGGLAPSVATLGAALIGERLRTQGIFRSFALSSLFFNVGSLLAGRIYQFGATSFFLTKITMASGDIILVLLLWLFYQKNRLTRAAEVP